MDNEFDYLEGLFSRIKSGKVSKIMGLKYLECWKNEVLFKMSNTDTFEKIMYGMLMAAEITSFTVNLSKLFDKERKKVY